MNLKKKLDKLAILNYFFEEFDSSINIALSYADDIIECIKSFCNKDGFFEVSFKNKFYKIVPYTIDGDKDVDLVIGIYDVKK